MLDEFNAIGKRRRKFLQHHREKPERETQTTHLKVVSQLEWNR